MNIEEHFDEGETGKFARQIKSYLNQSLNLEPGKLTRLRSARERALARQRQSGVALWAPAWAGNVLGRGGQSPVTVRWVLPIAVVVCSLIGFQQWQQTVQADHDTDQAAATAEIEEIDAALLKSDLPIDAYLNSDFKSWLKGSAE